MIARRSFLSALVLLGCSMSMASGQACGGSANSALVFDGINDVVQIAQNPALSTFPVSMSIELWLKTTSANQQYAISAEDPSQSSHSFDVATSGGQARFQISGSFALSTPPVNNGAWHHVAFVLNGATNTLLGYLDGALVASTSHAPLGSTVNNFLIGNDQPIYNNAFAFSGSIDEVRIWNVARTASQIASNMNLPLPGASNGSQIGLVGYWRLDEGAGSSSAQVIVDQSPTGANGTRGGTASVGSDDPLWTTTDAAPMIYSGGGGSTGQANVAVARLEINGVGTGGAPGPFVVTALQGGPLSFTWFGDPSQPCILLMGPLNVANTVSPLIGSVDIGSPCLTPAFSDIVVLFDGTSPSYSNFFTTNGAGTTTQSFMLPIGLPSGPLMTVQGVMGNATGSFPLHMTAAFQIGL